MLLCSKHINTWCVFFARARVYFEYWGQLFSPEKKRHHVHIQLHFYVVFFSFGTSTLHRSLGHPEPIASATQTVSQPADMQLLWTKPATLFMRGALPLSKSSQTLHMSVMFTPEENTIDGLYQFALNWWLNCSMGMVQRLTANWCKPRRPGCALKSLLAERHHHGQSIPWAKVMGQQISPWK